MSVLDPALTGLEQLTAVFGEGGAGAGITHLLGMTTVALEPGHVAFAVVARQEMCNPAGTVHGGIAATMLDEPRRRVPCIRPCWQGSAT